MTDREIIDFRGRAINNNCVVDADGQAIFILRESEGRELQLRIGEEVATVMADLLRSAFPSIGRTLH